MYTSAFTANKKANVWLYFVWDFFLTLILAIAAMDQFELKIIMYTWCT